MFRTRKTDTITRAYTAWKFTKGRRFSDRRVTPFLGLEASAPWLGLVRWALCYSGNELARRLGISRQAVSRLQQRERTGRITLASLRRVAEAMDCELVYCLRPKCRRVFSKIVWEQLEQPALGLTQRRPFRRGMEDVALWKAAVELFVTPGIRRRNHWTERYRERLEKVDPSCSEDLTADEIPMPRAKARSETSLA